MASDKKVTRWTLAIVASAMLAPLLVGLVMFATGDERPADVVRTLVGWTGALLMAFGWLLMLVVMALCMYLVIRVIKARKVHRRA